MGQISEVMSSSFLFDTTQFANQTIFVTKGRFYNWTRLIEAQWNSTKHRRVYHFAFPLINCAAEDITEIRH